MVPSRVCLLTFAFESDRISCQTLPLCFDCKLERREGDPMKRQYVNELAEGMPVDAAFALRAKEMRSTRSRDPYLAMELGDRTGQIGAVFFRPSGEALAVPAGSIVRVRGTVTVFRGMKRISVSLLQPADVYDASDLIAPGPVPIEALEKKFAELRSGIADKGLRRILGAVFDDPVFADRFAKCPGSQAHHHAYLGGLIEHTVSVASLCSFLADQYPQVDRDLLVTAALLHDIGKCDELVFETSIEYTDQGRLLGHVVLGLQRLHSVVERGGIGIPRERLTVLEHALLSHHGELEWGSPKRPSSLEALLLHHADNLDAKAAGFSALLSGPVRVGETWTAATNLFRRPLYAPRFLEDDMEWGADEDAQYSTMRAVC